ncbi:MAG: DNA recombination protein RmuC [Patescibacteria group bacterium]|jgi:DNA recombination protein RmuC
MVPVYILLGIVIVLLVYFILRQPPKAKTEEISEEFFNKFNEKFPDIMKNANSLLVSMAAQKLDSQKQEIEVDLANKKENIEKMVKQVLDELKNSSNKLEQAEKDRVSSFSSLKKSLENSEKITQHLSATTESLSKVLSNNQLRGAFGEKVAEDLLKMSGFVVGTDYEVNKEQSTTETRPDFAILLPDGARINVDVKFPYSSLTKMAETSDEETKNRYLKMFERDVKDKIKQVCTRDYIDPENKTVDFVILFIPNEMIFSFIYDKMTNVWEEAMKNKVVLCGPFSFTAILRMVRQAYDNFRYQNNIQQIITYIKLFEKEFDSYNQEFEKIGDRIESLSRQYNTVSTTRTRQLLKVVDRIKIEDSNQKSSVLELEK